MTVPHSIRLLIAPLLASGCLATAKAQTAATQTIPLQAGWNLIAFQVEPANPAPAAVFSSLGGNFRAAFSYDAATKQWTSFQNPTTPGVDPVANTLPGIAMANIQLGKGYWIWMNNAQSFAVSGTVPSVSPPMTLAAGWDLIAIPTDAQRFQATGESISLMSVLARAGIRYDALLRWESGSNSLRSVSTDPAAQEFTDFDPAKGYWVNSTGGILNPNLIFAMRSDIDLEPAQAAGQFPGPEDLAISFSSPGPVPASEQRDIRFLPGEDWQTISFSNSGGGIVLWTATWIPSSAPGSQADGYIPWITLSTSRDEKPLFDANGVLVRDYKTLSGVTTTDNDIIYLRLDRRTLLPGAEYSGKVLLETSISAEPIEFKVRAKIAPLRGEWSGFAVVQTVNGKRNKVPDIDLAVNFFGDSAIPGLIRGTIDSGQSLLWPVDVPLVGYQTAPDGTDFFVSGSFILSPGDQNNEPFDDKSAGGLGRLNNEITNEGDPNNPNDIEGPGAEDVDWNNDGKVDAINPYPFPIQRAVQIQGALTKGSVFDGYVIEGRYTEIVTGMLKEPIRLEGIFTLYRQSDDAFRSTLSRVPVAPPDTGVQSVVRKVAPLTFVPTRTGSVPETVISFDEVLTSLAVERLELALDWASAKNPSTGNFEANSLRHGSLVLTLESPLQPAGTTPRLTLYDYRTGAVSRDALASVSFPKDRPLGPAYGTFLNSLEETKGVWKLRIENHGLTATLNSAVLTLVGQPVFDLHGKVIDAEKREVANASVNLQGFPFSQSVSTDDSGNFTMRRLPGLPANFAVFHSYLGNSFPGASLSDLLRTPSFVTRNPIEAELASRFRPLSGVPPPPLQVPGFGSLGGEAPADRLVIAIPNLTSGGLPIIMANQRLHLPGEPKAPTTANYIVTPTGGPAGSLPRGRIEGFAPLAINFFALNSPAGVTWRIAHSPGYSGPSPDPVVLIGPNPGEISLSHPDNYSVQLRNSAGTVLDEISVVANRILPTGTFTGGGVVPSPVPAPDPGSNIISFQQTYAASFDVDLQPKLPDFGSDFSSDGFSGEDHNYVIPVGSWVVPVVTGTVTSFVDLGLAQSYTVPDTIYHAPVRTLPTPQAIAANALVIGRYQIACHLGGAIVPPGIDGPSVLLPSEQTLSARVLQDSFIAAPAALPVNYYFRLINSPFRHQWTVRP